MYKVNRESKNKRRGRERTNDEGGRRGVGPTEAMMMVSVAIPRYFDVTRFQLLTGGSEKGYKRGR